MNRKLFITKLTVLLAAALMLIGNRANAQLTGTKVIGVDYATIALAVADLNTQGVGAGGVTFNVPAGYTETIAATISVTATGTAANPIVFQKSGAGADPVITAYTGGVGTPGTAVQDGIWRFIGSDYVTINGIDLAENAANTTNPSTMEYGYAFYKTSATDGCQNNTIQNCTITLNRVNNAAGTAPMVDGSTAILFANSLATTATTVLTVTAASGANSNNKIYSNTVQNCNTGIAMIGFADVTPFTNADQANDIGGVAALTGNTIVNYGGGTGTTVTAVGVRTLAQYGLNVSYNTVNSNNGAGVNHAGPLQGIFVNTATSASASINNNTVTLKGGGTSTALTGIQNASGSTAASNTININNNSITGCTYTTATSGSFTGIVNSASPATLNMNSNSFTSNATNGTSSATTFLSNTGAVTTNININSNNVNGWTFNAANSGSLSGISNTSGGSAALLTMNTNNIQGITYSALSTGSNTYLTQTAAVSSATLQGNTFTNLNVNISGAATFINQGYSIPSTGQLIINNNSIVTAYNHGGAAGLVTLTTTNSSSGTGSINNYTNNNFSNITVAGSSAITGFNNTDGGTGSTKTITGNTFNNWTAVTGTINTMNFGYWNGVSSLSNNTITNITGQGTVTGITMGSSANNATSITVANNIITGLTSTGTGGSVTGLTCSNSSTLININNNTINTLSSTGSSSTVTGLAITGAGASTNVFSNIITGLTVSGATTPTVRGISVSGGTLVNVNNNTLNTYTASAGTAPIVQGVVVSGGTTININNNPINTLAAPANTSAVVQGVAVSSGTTVNVNNNTINGLTDAGTTSPVESGIAISGGTGVNVFKNKIYDISASAAIATTAGAVNGVLLSGGTAVKVYNNLIGDLRTPAANLADAIRGISITSASTGNFNVYYNSVYINATSSGANFGTTGLFHTASATATIAALDLRNNIFVNLSTPNGTGLTEAYRRSAAATLANFVATSNNNLYYAGAPSASRLIMYDGTNSYQTIATYKTAMATIDQFATTENPNFVSTTGSALTFLHINPAIITVIESGGTPVAGITDDYDNEARNVGTPDIGADEFSGISGQMVINSVTLTTPVSCSGSAHTITANITNGVNTLGSVTLNYSFNGVPQSPITMTGGNTAANATSNWTGVIPIGVPVNTVVAWSVTASDASYNRQKAGTTYKDAPLLGYPATASASLTTVCSGANTVLTGVFGNLGSGTVGNGVGSNASTEAYGAAYPTWYGNGREQYLILASELTTAGILPGNLTSVSFNVTGLGVTTDLLGYTISIAPTVLTSITTVQSIAATTVYGPIADYVPTLGINTHTFATPFVWDGTSNIIVDICFSDQVAGNGSALTTQTITPFNCNAGYYADGAVPNPCGSLTTSNSTYTHRPNMTFTYANLAPVTTFAWSDGGPVGTTNPLTVAPSNLTASPIVKNYTVTGSDVNGCTLTSAPPVAVTVNPLPAAPTATNSNQCGLAVPTASVAGTGTTKWYSAPTGGTLLQTGGNTYTTAISTTTTFYVALSNGICESNRTPVTINVNAPDAVTATGTTPVCANGTTVLNATKAPGVNTYVYTWTANPAAGSGIPVSLTGPTQNVVPTAAGTYTYTVTAVDAALGCTAASTQVVLVNPLPTIASTTATPGAICSGATTSLAGLSLLPGTYTVGNGTVQNTSTTYPAPYGDYYTGSRHQMLIPASELTAAGMIAGPLNSLAFSVAATNGTLPLLNFTISVGNTALTALTTTFVNGLTQVFNTASYSPTVGLNTHSFSTPFNWDGVSNIVVETYYSNCTNCTATTCNAYGSGTTYSSNCTMNQTATAYISTSYYYSDAASCQIATQTTANGGTFSQRPNMVFGRTATGTPYTWTWNPGNLSGNVVNVSPVNAGASPITATYTVTAVNTTTNCSNTGTVNVTVNPLPNAPTAVNSNQCGLGVPTASVAGTGTPMWYSAPTGGTLLQTGGNTYTTAINATTTFYVSLSNGTCESAARTPVTVTVTQPDVVTASGTSPICLNGVTALVATKGVGPNNYVYTWAATPPTGSGMPTPVTGANQNITPTAAGTYTYTVTAVDATLGCTTTSTKTVVVNPLPNITSATGTPATLCSGASTSLVGKSIPTAPGSATVGNGAGSNSSSASYGAAYPTYYGNGRQQYLIRSSELTAAGFVAGNLTSVSFNVTNNTASPNYVNGYNISIAPTALNTINTIQTLAFTNVFSIASYTPTLGVNTHTFTTPFNWDGISNIIVDICFSDGVIGSTGIQTQQTTLGFSCNAGYYADGAVGNACLSTSNTNAANTFNRPNMTFTGTLGTDLTGSLTWTWNPGSLSGSTVSAVTSNPGTTPITATYTVVAVNPTTTCFNSATVPITVNPLPTAAITGATSICNGQSANIFFTGTPNATVAYTRNAVAQTPIVLDNTGSFTLNTGALAANTTYALTTATAPTTLCPATIVGASVLITIKPNPTAVATVGPPNSPLCAGQTINLHGATDIGTTFQWAGPSFASLQQNPSITNAQASASGTYTFTATANGCSTPGTVSVTVNPNPIAGAGSNSPICEGQSINLTGVTDIGTLYAWNGPAPNNYTSNSQNASVLNATVLDAGTYTFTATANGCSTTATTTVVVNPAPGASPTSNSPICAGQTLNLSGGTLGTIFSWTGPNLYSSTSQNPSITNTTTAAAGTYTFTASTAGGCSNTGTTTVVVNPRPTANFTGSEAICSAGTAILGLAFTGTGPWSYTYFNGVTSVNGSTATSPTTVSVTPGTTTSYTVTALSDANCTALPADITGIPTVTVNSTGGWTGAVSTNWQTAANWCGGIPTVTTDVVIPGTAINMPTLSTGTGFTHDLAINPGATVNVTSAATMEVHGNISGPGSFSAVGGNVNFDGAGTQTTPGFTADNVTVNPGVNVTLNGGDITASTMLTLNGMVTLGNSNLIADAITGGTASAYVRTNGTGTLRRLVGNTDIDFPVGNSSYNPLILNNAGASDHFYVRVLDAVYADGYGNNPTLLGQPVANRTWLVDEAILGGSNVTMTAQWNGVEEINGFIHHHNYIGHYTGSWPAADFTASPALGTDPYTVTKNNITTFSPFAVFSAYDPLAIKLQQFTGVLLDKTTSRLDWLITELKGNEHFEIQRSLDGKDFTTSIGTSSAVAGVSNYNMYDRDVAKGYNYYRLKVTDINGQPSFSNVVTLLNTDADAEIVSLSPSVTTGKTTALIQSNISGKAGIKVFDMVGKLIYDMNMQLHKGENHIDFDFSGLASGTYLMHIVLESGMSSPIRFIKQ